MILDPYKLFICGSAEVPGFQSKSITHMLRVANPGSNFSRPPWLQGPYLQLSFGDVVSETDAKRCGTKAPSKEAILEGLTFFRTARKNSRSRILVSCDYGASRSPALAYVFLADQLGPAQEVEAFRIIMQISPNAVPNGLIVSLGDRELNRQGALLHPLRALHSRINEELSR
jgi:predicted protein tyrosine phosphatase